MSNIINSLIFKKGSTGFFFKSDIKSLNPAAESISGRIVIIGYRIVGATIKVASNLTNS